MKKNGFTLVELLAVIVVIGLIVTLAVTNVIPIFRKSKTKGFANDAITLAEAAKLKYKDDKLNSIDDDLFIGNISGKKCYSIEEHLLGQYASNLNTRIEGSVEVCYGSLCEYDTKIWITDGSRYIDGKIIDENSGIESLVETNISPENYSTCGISLTDLNIAYEYSTPGSINSLTIPETGRYKLEVWGAQGGSPVTSLLLSASGGYGGYSVGEVELTAGQTIYIVVGGKGQEAILPGTQQTLTGGYNGGGNAWMRAGSGTTVGSGGGATHIALDSGLLSTFQAKQDRLLIVAAGGGGGYSDSDKAGVNTNGGNGGGFTGGNAKQIPESCVTSCTAYERPTGATQTTGGIGVSNWSAGTPSETLYVGTFGQGATGTNSYGGGGGGFYGGASGNYVAGAGGSGYIGSQLLTNKAMYCYDCPEATNLPTDENIFTVSTVGNSQYRSSSCTNGYSETPKSKCAKADGGFARITHLS